MDFLQRHLPRLHQAVQSALEYLTNVTAQIFGAPANAPQPRDAPAKMPLKSEGAAAPAEQETFESQGVDDMTVASDEALEDTALEATEESMKIYGIQQDVENQAQETQVRHQKENVEKTLLDHYHTIGDGKNTFNQHQLTIEKHKDQSCRKVTTDDPKPTKSEDVDNVPSIFTREILHIEVHTLTKEEVQKVNQEEHARIKAEEKSSTSILEDVLRYVESKRYQEHEVPLTDTSNDLIKSDLDLELKIENSCITSNVNDSPILAKTIISQEISEGALICHATVTATEVYQESTGVILAVPLKREDDDLDVSDIKKQHKKLVTPVSAADKSPCNRREEERKTWEHLQETAVRLALHCDLFQDDDQRFETSGSGKISKTTHVDETHSSRPDEQGDSEECLEKTSYDPNEVQELSSDEKEQSEEICELSESEEDNQNDEKDQNIEKTRKRVHFSPSTEERDQMFGLSSEDTGSVKVDLIEEGALEPTTEYRDQPPHLNPRPKPNDKEDDLGLISNIQDIEPSLMDPTTIEDQGNPLDMGGTVWYDEIENTRDEEMCESIGDIAYHCVNLGFQQKETMTTIPDRKSSKELSTDVPSVEEIQDSEEEPIKNSMSTPHDLIIHSGENLEVAYVHGESTCSFNNINGSLQKSPEVVSDHWEQDGSNLADHEEISASLEVISQSSEEIKVDLLIKEDLWSLKQHFHEEGNSGDTESKEELLGLWHHPSVKDTEGSIKVGLASVTDKLHLHEGVIRLQAEPDASSETTAVVYTSDEGYNQTFVQELDISKNEQSDIIGTESGRSLSTDSSHVDKLQTAKHPAADEDNEGSVGRSLAMKTETQKEEDKTEMEYEGVEGIKVVEIEETKDYMWYSQNSYQSDEFITYSDTNEEQGSQKDQNPAENAEVLSEQSPNKDSENEVMSKGGEAEQTNQQLSGSDEDTTKVGHLYIVSEAEPRNTSLSAYSGDDLGLDDELEGICRPPETGFDLLSEIQSVINTSQSEEDISEVTRRSNVTHTVVSSGNIEIEYTKVDKILEGLAEENETSVTPDEALGDQCLDTVNELELPLDTGSSAKDHIEVIFDQTFEVDSVSEQQDGSDLLSMDHEVFGIMSTMNAGQSDKKMEDVDHANEENIAGILSEEITVEEHENLKEYSPDLHLSEELASLIKPKQIFEGELYSSIEIAVAETKIDASDVGLDINNTSVEISENIEKEDGRGEEVKYSITLDETSSGQLRDLPLDTDKERGLPSDTGYSAENNIDINLEQISEVDNIQDKSDPLSEMNYMLSVDPSVTSVDHDVLGIMSTMNVVQLDKAMDDVGHANEENITGILSAKITEEEHENVEEHSPGIDLLDELGSLIEPKQIFEEEYYSSIEIAVTESNIEVSDVVLDVYHTSVEMSENMEKEDDRAGEDKSSVTLDGTSSGHLIDLPLDTDKERDLILDIGYSAEDNIDVNLEQKSEVDNIQDRSDPLSEINYMLSVDCSVTSEDHEVLGIMSTMNVVQLDKVMDDVDHANEENIKGILSEKITDEEHENLEEHSSGIHLSNEPGSLIESKQIFKDEYYSSIEIAVTESKIHVEVSNVGLEINHTAAEISKNKEEDGQAEEDKYSVNLDETSSGHLGDQPLDNVKELDVPLTTESFGESHNEVIVGSVSDLNLETLEGGGDFLANMGHSVEDIAPTLNIYELDKRMEDRDHSNDEAIVENHEEDHPNMGLSEELGSIIDLEQTFEEQPYSSIVLIETRSEDADINNDPKKTASVLVKETDASTDAQRDLIPDHRVERISEDKDDAEESQCFETLDDASRRQFRDLEIDETVISLETGYLVEDIDIILGSTSELSQGEDNLLSGIHCVEIPDQPTEVISLVSTTGEEDILNTSKAWAILEESAVRVDTLPDTVILDDQGKVQNKISAISHPEELGSSLESSIELNENQHNSSSLVSIEESHISLEIVNTSEKNINILLDFHEPREMDLSADPPVITTDYSVDVTTITSPLKLVALDEAAGQDIIQEFLTTDEKEDSEETTQELCPSQFIGELEKMLHEQDSSSATLTTGTEEITGFDNESSNATYHFGLSGLGSKLLPSIDRIKQEGMEEGGSEEQLSNEEALRLGQTKQVLTMNTEEPSLLIEPSTHKEMSKEDQETLVGNRKGALMEPSVEEDDVVDNSLLPHNTLDVSAQKSRVQLRRKTSIRRKQGQRQVTTESEPLEPPQPVIRPRPMGVALFPGQMPIFAMAPTMAPAVSHPAEAQKEEKLAEEEQLVKPKKGIPRHAGFGIPHPQMMQELQARLKKKKPNE